MSRVDFPDFVQKGLRAQQAVDAALAGGADPGLVLQEVKANFEKILSASERLQVQTQQLSEITEYQSAMIGAMIDELCPLAQTLAIPIFFREQIMGTLTRVREIGEKISKVGSAKGEGI